MCSCPGNATPVGERTAKSEDPRSEWRGLQCERVSHHHTHWEHVGNLYFLAWESVHYKILQWISFGPLRSMVHYIRVFTTSGCSLHQSVHYIRVFTTSGCSLHQGVHYIRVFTTSGVHYIRVFRTSGCSGHQGVHYIRVFTTSGCSIHCIRVFTTSVHRILLVISHNVLLLLAFK